ncbi:MAG: lysostaphin resistance A-like protein [Flavobacteriales bacterium]
MFDALTPQDLAAAVATGAVLLGFIGYFFMSKNDQGEKENRPTNEVIKMRYLGFLWMGIFPFVLVFILTMSTAYTLSDFGLGFSFPKENWYWILGFAAVLIPMNYFNAKLEDNLKIYPQIREKEWNGALQRKEYVTWFLYLVGYEWLFRGVFFFGCREVMGFWPAVAINVAVYSLVHIPKGLKETLASIPLGIVLCIIVEQTQVFYAAAIIHFTQAASSSFFSLRAHPDMKIIKE